MPGRRETEELVEQEDRSIDKPRKRSGGTEKERSSPTSHPEQHEEFAGTEREPGEEAEGQPNRFDSAGGI